MSNLILNNLENKEKLELLKKTIAKGATDIEFGYFIETCKATNLNPFKKEIWFIKINNELQIMTGIHGFYSIANSHPQFDGVECEIVEENGKIKKAVARVYRKDRRIPTVAEAYLDEYGKNNGLWKNMPRVMLSKCAESMALRKAFPTEMNGIYTKEEMPDGYSQDSYKNIDEPIDHDLEKARDKFKDIYKNHKTLTKKVIGENLPPDVDLKTLDVGTINAIISTVEDVLKKGEA